MRTRRLAAASLLLLLGPLAPAGAVVSEPVAPTTTALTGSNPGVGALELSAVVSSEGPPPSTGAVVFEVDGREPVTVPLGRSLIVGQTDDRPAPDGHTAVVGFTGLDPHGTYHATATYVPDDEAGPEGDRAEVTTTLTRAVDRGRVAIQANGRGRAVELLFSVQVYPPGAVVGSVTIEDRTLGVVVTRRTQVRADRPGFFTVRGVSRGVHRYRATFVPAPRLRATMTGSVATSRVVIGSW